MSVPGIAHCWTAAPSVPFQPSLGRFNPFDLPTQIMSSGAQSHHSLHGSVLVLKKCPAWYLSHATQLLYINVDICTVFSIMSLEAVGTKAVWFYRRVMKVKGFCPWLGEESWGQVIRQLGA